MSPPHTLPESAQLFAAKEPAAGGPPAEPRKGPPSSRAAAGRAAAGCPPHDAGAPGASKPQAQPAPDVAEAGAGGRTSLKERRALLDKEVQKRRDWEQRYQARKEEKKSRDKEKELQESRKRETARQEQLHLDRLKMLERAEEELAGQWIDEECRPVLIEGQALHLSDGTVCELAIESESKISYQRDGHVRTGELVSAGRLLWNEIDIWTLTRPRKKQAAPTTATGSEEAREARDAGGQPAEDAGDSGSGSAAVPQAGGAGGPEATRAASGDQQQQQQQQQGRGAGSAGRPSAPSSGNPEGDSSSSWAGGPGGPGGSGGPSGPGGGPGGPGGPGRGPGGGGPRGPGGPGRGPGGGGGEPPLDEVYAILGEPRERGRDKMRTVGYWDPMPRRHWDADGHPFLRMVFGDTASYNWHELYNPRGGIKPQSLSDEMIAEIQDTFKARDAKAFHNALVRLHDVESYRNPAEREKLFEFDLWSILDPLLDKARDRVEATQWLAAVLPKVRLVISQPDHAHPGRPRLPVINAVLQLPSYVDQWEQSWEKPLSHPGLLFGAHQSLKGFEDTL